MQKCVFCPVAQNFLQVGAYLQRVVFRPQWPLPIAQVIWWLCMASVNFSAIENVPPYFSVHCQKWPWPNGWMDQDTTWYRGRFRPRRHCVRWRPIPIHAKEHSSSPHFSTHCSGPRPRRPAFTHNSCCRIRSAQRAALVAILRIIATRLVHSYTYDRMKCRHIFFVGCGPPKRVTARPEPRYGAQGRASFYRPSAQETTWRW